MENIMINIKALGYAFLESEFKHKDIISLEELLSAYEDRVFDVERLEEEIRCLKNTTEEDEYNSYMDDLRNRKRDENE